MMPLGEIESIYSYLPIASIILQTDSPHFTIAAANAAFTGATGTAGTKLIGEGFFDVFPANPDDTGVRTNEITAAFEHVLHQKQPHQIRKHRYDLPSGKNGTLTVRYWKIHTYPLVDEHGAVQYIVQTSEDITALHHAEEQAELAWQRNFDLFNFSPVPMWAYDTVTLQIKAANKAAQVNYSYTQDEFLSLKITALFYGDTTWQRPRDTGNARHVTQSGKIIEVDMESRDLPTWGENTRIIVALDVTERSKFKQLEYLEKQVLELITKTSGAIRDALSFYVLGIEALFPQMRCSIMEVKNDRIYNWASPSLPSEYQAAIEGLVIGPKVGSCGTATFRKHRVITRDIATDPLWDGFREAAQQAGLRACWSNPIINAAGEVMATFAIYYAEPKLPNDDELKIIERATVLLTIVLENKRYSETLNETSLLMTQGQELAQFGNWAWDVAANTVTWSDSLFHIYGLDKTDFKATFEGYQELLHPEDREMVYRIIGSALESKKDIEFEERIIRPTGEIRYLKSWGKVKCDEAGVPVKMIGACLDITEGKNTQIELIASNERYTYVNKATNDAIYDWNITRNHIQWGDAFYRLFSYEPKEENYLIEKWASLVHPDDRAGVNQSLTDTLQDPLTTHWTAAYRLKKANDDYAFVEETGYILRDEQGAAIRMIGVLRDVTQRISYLRTIEQHNQRLQEIAWAQAHLVRAPLANILGLLELINDQDTDAVTRMKLLSYLNTSAISLDEIIKNIITKSQNPI